jgi:hypothetical protein
MARRKHFKVSTLPREVQDAINQKIADGESYPKIAAWIRQMGHEVGKSSVARYGKDFMARMEVLKTTQKQAEAIMTEMGGRPALEIEEATAKLASQLIMEHLIKTQDLKGASLGVVLKAVAQIQGSSVARERVKMDWKQKLDSAFKKIEEKAEKKKQPVDRETLEVIKREVYGLV